MALPPSGISHEGIPCVPVALGRDSESQATLVIYTTGKGLYWAMPIEGFETEPLAPTGAMPVFSVQLGKYRHFKGNGYAAVVRARDPVTLRNRIVYQNKEGDVWVRDESMWLEEVRWPDGEMRARFVPAED